MWISWRVENSQRSSPLKFIRWSSMELRVYLKSGAFTMASSIFSPNPLRFAPSITTFGRIHAVQSKKIQHTTFIWNTVHLFWVFARFPSQKFKFTPPHCCNGPQVSAEICASTVWIWKISSKSANPRTESVYHGQECVISTHYDYGECRTQAYILYFSSYLVDFLRRVSIGSHVRIHTGTHHAGKIGKTFFCRTLYCMQNCFSRSHIRAASESRSSLCSWFFETGVDAGVMGFLWAD